MIDRAAILALVPHGGDMCLWDRVLDWDDGQLHLQAEGHHAPGHPLRSGGVLRAVHLCEYGAQAMAVHGGLRAQAHGGVAAPGLLVALRAVEIHVARIDDLDGPLDGHAQLLTDGAAGWTYAFALRHRGALLASGRATVMLPP